VRVLVIGSGGREHALIRALTRDGEVTGLHAAPGNPGIAALAEVHDVTAADPDSVTALAARVGADLVVIGPEAPLVAGVADAVRAAGITCFGPSQAAAAIEGSKSFAKDVMSAAGIPTAASRTCTTQAEAEAALAEFGPPYVVKADGLAAGKGVVVTADRREAAAHALSCGKVVIEEFLNGPEVSVFAIADGSDAVALLPAQDYKRAHDGGTGPNTGGMGAYAPLPWAPPDLADQVMAEVIRPAVAQLRRRGTPYSGLLYAGLSLTAAGIRVVEFNARFGDPETQVILDRLGTPLGGLLHAAATGALAGVPALNWVPGAAVTVVVAAEGYPGPPAKGDEIAGIDDAERAGENNRFDNAGHAGENNRFEDTDENNRFEAAGEGSRAYVLHAGTAIAPDGRLVSSGGRVLNVVGTGPDVAAARAAAYAAAGRIRMRGGWYRKDIADLPEGTPARS
jgi:phosphoribosylamine--glycine ligase